MCAAPILLLCTSILQTFLYTENKFIVKTRLFVAIFSCIVYKYPKITFPLLFYDFLLFPPFFFGKK